MSSDLSVTLDRGESVTDAMRAAAVQVILDLHDAPDLLLMLGLAVELAGPEHVADEDQGIAAAYLSGLNAREVAERHGTTPWLVRKAVLAAGGEMRGRGGDRTKRLAVRPSPPTTGPTPGQRPRCPACHRPMTGGVCTHIECGGRP